MNAGDLGVRGVDGATEPEIERTAERSAPLADVDELAGEPRTER